MILSLNIPDDVIAAIEAGEKRSLEGILQHKVRALFKKHRPRRPFPGRPKFTAEQKIQKDLEKELRGVFENLREMFPDDFAGLYGALEQRFKEAAANGDLQTLERFANNKPWLQPDQSERN